MPSARLGPTATEAVPLSGTVLDFKPGYEVAPPSPQISTDSSLSHMIPVNEDAISNKEHERWQEEAWVWSSINMVAEPVNNGGEGQQQSQPRRPRQARSAQQKRKRSSPSSSGVSSNYASESCPAIESTAAAAAALGPPRCQAEQCTADLTGLRTYNQRYKVCQTCIKAPTVTVKGKEVRFCQQCSCFHDLSCFDAKKRSCREQLEKHNKRRRERIDAAARRASKAGASEIQVADNISGFAGKRTRVMTPMDSVSSDHFDSQGVGHLSVRGLASAFHGQTSITPGTLPNPNTAAAAAAAPAPQQQSATELPPVPVSKEAAAPENKDIDKALEAARFDTYMGDADGTGSPFAAHAHLPLGAPTSGDLGILRQLALPNSYFVMPNATQPLLTGPSTAPDFDLRMDALQFELGNRNGNNSNNNIVSSGSAPLPAAPSSSTPPKSNRPALDSMGSFKVWADKALLGGSIDLSMPQFQGAGSAPLPGVSAAPGALQPWDSLDNFWGTLGFQPAPPAETFTAPAPAELTKVESFGSANSNSIPASPNPNPPLDLTRSLGVPDDILQDALDLLQEPMTTVYSPPSDQLIRLSFKMFNRTPEDLTPDLRERLRTIAKSGASCDSYLQQGCTHLVVDMLVPGADDDAALSTPADLAAALASGPLAEALPEGHFLNGEGVVQGPGGAAVRVENGCVVAAADGSPAAPILLGTDSTVICNGYDMSRVKLYVIHDLAAGPVSDLSIAVRKAGSFVAAEVEEVSLLGAAPTYSPSAGLVCMTLTIPSGKLSEGLLMLEVVLGNGILSAPLPVVVTSDTVLMKELSQLGPGRPLSDKQDSLKALDARLVADLGLVLDSLSSEGTLRGDASKALGASVSTTAARARSLLLVAAERGWAAVASAVLDTAAADCANANDAVALVDLIRGPKGPGLLVAAVRGGNSVLLSLLLEWATEEGSGIPLDVMAPHTGVSPLHVSAAINDGGVMAELLLEHAAPGDPSSQYAMWSDPNGRRISPEGVADKCRRTSIQSRMALKRAFAEGSAEQEREEERKLDPFAEPTEEELPPRPKPAGKSILAKARKTWSSFKKRLEREKEVQKAEEEAAGESSARPKFDRFDSATSRGETTRMSEPSSSYTPGMPVHDELETEPSDASLVAALPAMRPKAQVEGIPRTDSAREEAGAGEGSTSSRNAQKAPMSLVDVYAANVDGAHAADADPAMSSKARMAHEGLPGLRRRISESA